MKKNIIYLIYNTKQNGGNRVVFEQGNRLLKLGRQLRIITIFGKHPKWFPLLIPVERLSLKIALNLFIHPSSIIISTFWPTAYLSMLLRSRKKLYLVLGWEEEFYKNRLLRLCAKISLFLPLKKIAISKYLKHEIEKYTKQKNIYSLPGCAINTDVFKRNHYKRSTKIIYFLSVLSTYSWYKGPDVLLEAIMQLKERHPNYKFILVSSNQTKPYGPIFDFFYHNISSRKLAKLYQHSNFLLSTSRKEGFFLPGLEAMACGCPVITTDSGGIKEYAVNNRNCIMVKNVDHIWQSNVIEKLIRNKRKLNEMIKNGYDTAYKYKWQNIIDRLNTIILSQ
jgi:glycosyltransferase involved in cell wall biosynthesis